MNFLKIKYKTIVSGFIFSLSLFLFNVVKSQPINIDGSGDAIKTQNGSTSLLNWNGNSVTLASESTGVSLSLKGTHSVPTGYLVGNRNKNGKSTVGIKNWNNKYTFLSYHNIYTTIGTGTNDIMLMNNDGRVAIGKGSINSLRSLLNEDDGTPISADSYRLFVEKGILTEKIKCAIAGQGDWADYVFEEDYEMMDINDLEGFVTENKHLPNVPSAEEMVANGLDVAKMDAKLLEKIEEAYLYIIDMNKEMKAMNEKVDALANENGALKASLSAISTSGK